MKKIWVVFLVLRGGCFQLSTDEVLSRINERVKKVESFKAKMVTSTQMLAQMVKIEVDIRFKMPDKMRTEMNFPGLLGKQITISDGKTLWTYFEGLKQVAKIDITELSEQMRNKFMSQTEQMREPFKNFKRESIKYIKKEKVEGEETYLLEVTMPEMPGFLVKLPKAKFWISTNDGMVWKVVFYGGKEKEAMSVSCRDVEINLQLDESLFSFVPPPSAKIIDMGQMMSLFPMVDTQK